ncbi:MAG: hypothetical protein ACI89U_001978 [Gammaproteobacteria bacterium]|jgi:hypothetical protein
MKLKKSKYISKGLVLLVLMAGLSACSSVTMRPAGGDKDRSKPSYVESKPFYLVGIFGEHEIDVNDVCDGAEVSQMQTVMSSSDYVMSMLTLLIYTPRTAKVWCEE